MAEQQTRYVVAGMDGTGSKEWRRPDGANSHIFRFMKDVVQHGIDGWPDSRRTEPIGYWHGPATFGTETGDIADSVADWVALQLEALIKAHKVKQDSIKVCLVGHSRGCIAAMKVANKLADAQDDIFKYRTYVHAPVQVSYLGLYDAVDRTSIVPWKGVSIKLPLTNVGSIRHARRKNRSGEPSSRSSFGTFDTGAANTTDFDTAHGGMGGDPGYFTKLGKLKEDYYVNALRLVMTQQELTKEYGQSCSRLTGNEYKTVLARVKKSISEVPAVDKHIREGAKLAGFEFKQTSPLIQYAAAHTKLWITLESLK